MTVKIVFKDVAGVECPITLNPVQELEKPVQASPCGHIFERAAIQQWGTECPLDRSKIEKLNPVEWIKNADEQNSLSPEIPDEEKLSTEDKEKIERLKWLESSWLVMNAKNFADKFRQITVTHSIGINSFGTTETVTYTGEDIDCLYAEYWRQPSILGSGKHAEVTVNIHRNSDGSFGGRGHSICVLP